MKEEKKVTEPTTVEKVNPEEHPELIPAEPEKKPGPKKAMKLSADEILMKVADSKKGLDLYRFYRRSEDGTFYFYYAVFVVLPGTKQKYVRVVLTPDIGYISKDEDYKRKGRNSTGYTLMNFAYDVGGGLKLHVRYVKKDNKLSFEFYAASCDDGGIGFETGMTVSNPAEVVALKCGFTGYGNAHGLAYDDMAENAEKLGVDFENYLEPGAYPPGYNPDGIF